MAVPSAFSQPSPHPPTTYISNLHLVAQASDRQRTIAGYVIAWFDPHNALGLIEPIAVDPRFRGEGLGRALLSSVLRKLRDSGANTALVNIEPRNSSSSGHFASCGFRERDRNWAWARP